jgi:hypothetical protein
VFREVVGEVAEKRNKAVASSQAKLWEFLYFHVTNESYRITGQIDVLEI